MKTKFDRLTNLQQKTTVVSRAPPMDRVLAAPGNSVCSVAEMVLILALLAQEPKPEPELEPEQQPELEQEPEQQRSRSSSGAGAGAGAGASRRPIALTSSLAAR